MGGVPCKLILTETIRTEKARDLRDLIENKNKNFAKFCKKPSILGS